MLQKTGRAFRVSATLLGVQGLPPSWSENSGKINPSRGTDGSRLHMTPKPFKGLLAFLLIVLEWTRPSLPSPLRPICDLRVLNHFIKEAQDAEAAMKTCREGCTLSESVVVPQTTVDFDVWEKKNASAKAEEVQSGLWLLQQAFNFLRTSVTNAALHSHIDNAVRNLLSVNAVLHSLNIQEFTPQANGAEIEGTWRASSAAELLQVYVNFLRGKARLLLLDAQACQQDVS